MKKLLTIITITLLFSSCTTHTEVKCPCRVIGYDGYTVTVQGTPSNSVDNGKFTFRTKHSYQIGDIIK